MLRTLLVLAGVLLVPGLSSAQARAQQAIIETSAGTIVLDLLADTAPAHVALFIQTAGEGGYDGTIFHRMVRHGIVQGGDPLTKDPARRDRYGSGGLNKLAPEISGELLADARGGGRGPDPGKAGQCRNAVLRPAVEGGVQ